MPQRNCAGCGASFMVPERKRGLPRKWCSNACRMASLRAGERASRPPRFCAQCGEDISDVARAKYCSESCKRLALNARRRMDQHFTCPSCGVEFERPPTRGQRPKWCDNCRFRGRREKRCPACGETFVAKKGMVYCSVACSFREGRTVQGLPSKRKPKQLALDFPKDQRSRLRRAYEDGHWSAVIQLVRSESVIAESGCWEWPRIDSKGYARVSWSNVGVYRMVVEATLGAPLGSQAAHHTCANTRCVNPDHLQPVTHRANTAEMLSRRSYVERIAELEEALSALDPDHPLLRVIPLAGVEQVA